MKHIINVIHSFINKNTLLALLLLGVSHITTIKAQENKFIVQNNLVSYEINKLMTDADLSKITKKISNTDVATLVVSNIQRNNKNEIINIKVNFDSQNSRLQSQKSNSFGITPLALQIYDDENGVKQIQIISEYDSSSMANLNLNPDQKGIVSLLEMMQYNMKKQQAIFTQLLQESENEQLINMMKTNMNDQQDIFTQLLQTIEKQ